MTIAIGMWCTDGIVLATDSKEGRGFHKSSIHKMLHYRNEKGDSISMAGSGHGDVIEMAGTEIREKLMDLSQWSLLDCRKIVKDCLKDAFDGNIAPYTVNEQADLHIELLVALATGGQSGLFRAATPRKFRPVIGRHAAIGWGAFVADPLLSQQYLDKLPMKQAADIAACVLKHVEDQSEHCEPPTDIVLHGNDGSIYGYHPGRPRHAHVDRMNRWIDEIDKSIGALIFNVARADTSKIAGVVAKLTDIASRKPSGDPEDLYELE
jgi:hypothetical protein